MVRQISSISVLVPAVLVAAAGCGSALAQISVGAAPSVTGGASNLNVLPGTSTFAAGSMTANTFTSSFTGDLITSMIGGNTPGVTYSGAANPGSFVPFTVGALPVRIGQASLHANFKMVASGGNGIAGGNDPVVTVQVLSRLYQQIGGAPAAFSDPWLSAIEMTQTWTQNGNGLQIIDATLGPATSNYILTPGNYYLFQTLQITTSYKSTGVIQPTRGMTVEFGGALTSSTYSGLNYTFDWQTVPAPGSFALLGIGGLAAIRRKR